MFIFFKLHVSEPATHNNNLFHYDELLRMQVFDYKCWYK